MNRTVICIECKHNFSNNLDLIHRIKQRGKYGRTIYICKPCFEKMLPKNRNS